MFFFFFSSRRRHTRSDRDWSSDVCSSDLALESKPRLLIFRTQLEGAQVPDRGFVRPAEPQIRFREEDPRPPVFVVAGDCLEEWIDRILESRLAKKGDCVLEMFRGFLLRCGSWRLAIARADVRV